MKLNSNQVVLKLLTYVTYVGSISVARAASGAVARLALARFYEFEHFFPGSQ